MLLLVRWNLAIRNISRPVLQSTKLAGLQLPRNRSLCYLTFQRQPQKHHTALFTPAKSRLLVRAYSNDPRQRNPYSQSPTPLWVKPALAAAGGAALIVFAWPLLRFVILGGLAYGAYRLVRVWFTFREISRTLGGTSRDDIKFGQGQGGSVWQQVFGDGLFGMFSSAMGKQSTVVREIREVALASLHNACFKGGTILDMLPDELTNSYDNAITLGEAIQVDTVKFEAQQKIEERIEAAFPVVVDGKATELYVLASAYTNGLQADRSGVSVDILNLYTRLSSGEVVETNIDVVGDDKGGKPVSGDPKRNVRDAEYRDLH
ncbi:hypothetical protein GGI25_004340 [Coemansia spiralis]|uniref:Uncharacterized protein n=2 Tax=Coemansia TaxID=4863 RepID=A0A9W8G0J5_9FUNG|nr:hypothetical protein BX070DRAFT_228355 [Coemansia spiralis]KAJ1992073.1 hypothetical protein EDC05_003064 [Coemansia umbellata]KAJ2621425.1 hypothetical protein GGI26_004107 [Coemansia sp. RSA 1358]KAJ2674400.1 hypothetical protein GGI25_004340 [Coemansia spiralis]